MQSNTPRRIAYEALLRCFRDGAWSSKTLDVLLKSSNLTGRDAALATRITLGVLQNKTLLDYQLQKFLTGSINNLQSAVLIILELSAYQMLFLDKIPDRAIVNEAVNLCKETGHSKAGGLVNAVLRKLSLDKTGIDRSAFHSEEEYLSVKYSHPEWLVRRIAERHGRSFAEKYLSANNECSDTYIQVNTLSVSVSDYCGLLKSCGVSYSETACEGCLKIDGGAVTLLPGYHEGFFYVQDYSARLASEIAAAAPGMEVLDACAAPGGKSIACAIRMQGKGHVLSCDLHEKKLNLIHQNADRLGIGCIETRAIDGKVFQPDYEGGFDLVIADVPCSGLGVIGSKPEIRFKTEEEIAEFHAIQTAILKNVSRYVKPGGTLLYSTCTILQEENGDVVRSFLNDNNGFELAPFACCGIHAPNGDYTFWPNVDGSAGFYAAKMKRRIL